MTPRPISQVESHHTPIGKTRLLVDKNGNNQADEHSAESANAISSRAVPAAVRISALNTPAIVAASSSTARYGNSIGWVTIATPIQSANKPTGRHERVA